MSYVEREEIADTTWQRRPVDANDGELIAWAICQLAAAITVSGYGVADALTAEAPELGFKESFATTMRSGCEMIARSILEAKREQGE